MEIKTLNDLALAAVGARQDLGRLKDALPLPRPSLGETSPGESARNEKVEDHIDRLRALVDLDRLRALVHVLAGNG